ncbi:MAG: methyltransferase domain-containing protein [Dehalococcoidia bacterium]
MANLPGGTITFLFTDIEGSTRLLQQVGERYGSVLAAHQRLLRNAIAAHGGSEVDTQGDAFFAAFPRATSAVLAAIEAQRAFVSHLWPEGAKVRVRMALHTGQPRVSNERYVGLDVHRAARICAVAHGGQVLLSQTTADLVQDDLSPELDLTDLGEHRLKDLRRPEHIYQIVAPDLPADFPPLTSLEYVSPNLPVQLTGFANRTGAFSELARLLAATSIELRDLVRTVKYKVRLEYALPSLSLRPLDYAGPRFIADPSNSLQFDFPTLQFRFPDLYSSSSYKLLFSVGLCRETRFDPPLLNELDRLRGKYNIDRIVLWSTVSLDEQIVHLLKGKGIDLILFDENDEQDLLGKPLAHYVPIPGAAVEYSVSVNHVAEGLSRRLKKLFHLVLSEIAAPIYEKHYSTGRAATRAIMAFEEATLQKLLNLCRDEGRTEVALDIGCGTGRHSFLLARHFSEVYAYDFSPRMIEVANQTKRERNDTRISFCVNDVEYEQLSDEEKFYGRCDLIVASMGMGSFVEDTVRLLRRCHDWLKPGGSLFISFYNENSLALKLTPNWRDSSMATTIDLENDALKVELPGGISFNVFCKAYNETTKGEINKLFNIQEIYGYPTTMALLPNSLLRDPLAAELFSEIDAILADSQVARHRPQLKRNYGHHVIVWGRKQEGACAGYVNVFQQLSRQPPDSYQIIEHSPVLSVEDARRELGGGVPLESMVKTLIFKLPKTKSFLAVIIPADRMIDKAALAERFGVAKSSIKFASEKDVAEIGFPLGGVAPFGFREGIRIRTLIDTRLRDVDSDWLYMGTGDNRRTLKIQKGAFLEIVRGYEWVHL